MEKPIQRKYRDRLFVKIFSDKEKILKIPAPRFVVFYNGSKETDDCIKLKLSDMFEVPIPAGEFEWTATMLNINYGHNKKLLEQCKDLRDYSMYVKLVEESKKMHDDIREAVTAAVNEAIKLDLLDGYFKKCKEDAIMDCLTEFDEEGYKKFLRQEAYEEGMADGRAESQAEIAALKAEVQARIAELEARLAKYESV